MPRPIGSNGRQALQASTVVPVWLLTCEPVDLTLRCCSWSETIVYDGESYDAAPEDWRIEGEITGSSSLVPEPLRMSFDGAYQYDDASFIGRLLDSKWHQRPVSLQGLLLDPDSYTVIVKFFEWRGRMDTITTSEAEAEQAVIALNCEGGTFRALERNFSSTSNESQRKRSATDAFFANAGSKTSQQIPFGQSWVNVPGYAGAHTRYNGGPRGGGSIRTLTRSR